MSDQLDRKDMLAVVVRKVIKVSPIHPKADQVFQETEARLKNVFGSDYTLSRDLADYIFYSFPEFKNLNLYSFLLIYINWAFILDDFFDKHPEEIEKWLKNIREKVSPGDGYMVKHFQTIIDMSKKHGVISEIAFDQLIKLTLFWIENLFVSKRLKKGTILPTNEEYIESRMNGATFVLYFAQIDAGLETLPKGLAQDPNWIQFFGAAEKHICVMNDLASFRKEIRDGKMKSNYIYIKMKNNNMSAQEAVDSIVDEVNQCEQLVDYYGNGLKSWNNNYIDRYVEHVKHFLAGTSYWSTICTRYNRDLDC